MTTLVKCPSCDQRVREGARFCSGCGAPFDPPAGGERRGLSRGWRRSYGSSESVGMTIGLIALGLVVFFFLGLGFVIAAVVLLGIVWALRAMFGSKPVSPTAAGRKAADARHERAAHRVAEHHGAAAADRASTPGPKSP